MNYFNPLDLAGKNIIITGASSGIGKETAKVLSLLGARLALVARNEDKLKEVSSELNGDNHLIFPFDLSELYKIEALIKTIRNEIGYINGMAHSAGFQTTLPQSKTKPELYENIFNINVFAFAEMVRQLTRKDMFDKDGASFVVISSASGIIGNPGLAAYGASKAALINLVKTLALELASKKIRVNAICPALVKTEMWETFQHVLTDEQIQELIDKQPLGLGEPIDVANAVAYLLAQTGRWITGTSLVIDGGFSA